MEWHQLDKVFILICIQGIIQSDDLQIQKFYSDRWELIRTVKNRYCMKLMEWQLTVTEWQSDSITVAV